MGTGMTGRGMSGIAALRSWGERLGRLCVWVRAGDMGFVVFDIFGKSEPFRLK